MKFKVGDSVITLVEKGTVKEGDIGHIDAVHPTSKTYTVGFYATEDALLYSGKFAEEELSFAPTKQGNAPYVPGDVIEVLADLVGISKGSVGEIVSEISPGVYAVSFEVPTMSIPLLMPVKAEDFRKIGHHETHHHHHEFGL